MNDSLIAIFESELFSNPWPVSIGNKIIPGKKHKLPDACNKCTTRECLAVDSYPYTCQFGLDSIRVEVGDSFLVLLGIKGVKSPRKIDGISLSRESFSKWIDSVRKIQSVLDNEILSVRSDTLHYFHDPVKWAEQIKINSEKLIESSAGSGFYEKFNMSRNEIKSIYQSSKMLVDSIQMIDIFFNPKSASYGKKSKVNVYKLFDKVQSILFFSEGKKFNKRFNLTGSSYMEIFLYESFPTIALTLVHNALKYSKSREIEISVSDVDIGVNVAVESIGPVIYEHETKRIFEKGYRGKYSNQIHHDGSGMGLYVAQHVAAAHGFEIKVNSHGLGYESDGIPMAKNTFYFTVPS